MGARPSSAELPAALPMWMLRTGALPRAGPHPCSTIPAPGCSHRPKVPSSRGSRDEESSYLSGVINVLIHQAHSCTFQGLARLRVDHLHTQHQQHTRTQAQATSTGHPHQTLPKRPQAMARRVIPKTSGIAAATLAAGYPQPPLDALFHLAKPWPSPPMAAEQGT